MNETESGDFSPTDSMNSTSPSTVHHRSGVVMMPMDIAYVTVTATISLMSIFGCLVVLFVHWSYKDLRTSGRTMLVHLTVADLLTALGNLMGVTWYLTVDTLEYTMVYCKFHSALTIMSSIASFFWTVVIAWFVFWILISVQLSFSVRQQGFSIMLPVVCWGVPVAIAVTALAMDVLGYDHNLSQASWCWIAPEVANGLMWALITGKAWEVGTCVLTVCLYAAVRMMLLKQALKRIKLTSRPNKGMEKANTKLVFVPLVFIVIRIWGTVRFLLGSFAHEYASSSDANWIVILQGGGDSAQGFANFVMYIFFTSKIRKRLFRGCPCLCLRNVLSNEGTSSSVHSTLNHDDHHNQEAETCNARNVIESMPETCNTKNVIESMPETCNTRNVIESMQGLVSSTEMNSS